MKELKVKVTFTEELLGTASGNKKIHEEFIASKAPDAKSKEEEVEALGEDEVIKKDKTVFPKDKDGRPFLYDYQIKGFFKNAQKAYNYIGKDSGDYLPAYKSKIDNLVFVTERRVYLNMPGNIGNCQRPLRGDTAKGERTALANSETAAVGTTIEFTIKVLKDSLIKNVKTWLDYGALNGMGQWHNSGKGRFEWEEVCDG